MKINFLKKTGIALMTASMVFSAVAIENVSAVNMKVYSDIPAVDVMNSGQKKASQSSGFYVDGTTIRDANGNEFIMRGVNIAHAWYTDKTETSIRASARLGTNVVRVVCADGGQWTKTTYDEIERIIEICKENNQVCILEAHDATGSNSVSDIEKCADYWIEMKDLLEKNKNYVILNIANEWVGTWDGATWAEGSKKVIQKVRNAGIKNMIMIDSAGWGQYAESIHNYGKSVFESDPDKNTVFSIHMYGYAGGSAEVIRKNIDNSLALGIPVVIGEFGITHSDGDVDEKTIMSYCTEKRVGYLGWSWKGNSDELAYLDASNDWEGNSLTEWGNALFYDDYGIKNTSKICSVYSGSGNSGDDTDNTKKYEIKAQSGEKVTVELKGTPNATVNGCFGYKDNSGEWVSDEWETSLDGNGKGDVTYTVPAGVSNPEFQIWWSGVWNDSKQDNDSASCEMSGYSTGNSDDTDDTKKYDIKAKSGEKVKVELKGTPNATVNGCFGYKDNSGEWISDEWKTSLDGSGRGYVTYTVPTGVSNPEFQIWWSGVWNDSKQDNDSASCEMADYSVENKSTPVTPPDDKKEYNGFYVDGTTIRDANGKEFIMRGVNIAHAWYRDKTETSIKAAASHGTNVVRIVCANGGQWEKTTYDEIKRIIEVCKENNQVCILEAHDATGSDSISDVEKCADYWIEMKDLLIQNSDYVILNIANEWAGAWDGANWAEGSKKAIKKVRNAGIKNMIMIDSAGWGQYPDSIKDYGKSVFESDPDKNTVFSIHMYEYAGGDSAMVRNNIDNCLGTGVPVVIGEFGGQHTNGDVDEETIMSYCTEKRVGYLGWSWKGNNSDLAYLDASNDWEGTSLTEWGNALFYGDYGIKNTSKVCSVYGSDTKTAGDINDDGTVNIADAVILQKYILASESFSEKQFEIADINNDGHVDVFDMVLIRKMLIE